MSTQEPVTRRGTNTRQRILDATMALVREHGVAAVTLDDVQQAADVGRSQMYHYFDGRDDLMRAMVDSTIDQVLDGGADDLDTLDGIDRWFVRIEQVCVARDGVGGCPIGSLVGQLAEHDSAARGALSDAFERWQAPLTVGLTELRERGELPDGSDVEELSDFVMATIQGGLLLAQAQRDPQRLHHALAGARSVLFPST